MVVLHLLVFLLLVTLLLFLLVLLLSRVFLWALASLHAMIILIIESSLLCSHDLSSRAMRVKIVDLFLLGAVEELTHHIPLRSWLLRVELRELFC